MKIYSNMPFDGVWIDKNEPTILCDGGPPLCQVNKTSLLNKETSLKQRRKLQTETDLILMKNDNNKRSSLDIMDGSTWSSGYNITSLNQTSTYFLPFIPMKYNLDKNTIGLNVTHPQTGYTQYNTHSLNGHMMVKKIEQALESE